ncbi:HIT-like protein [Mycena floridula]|nr:HIT-like protein [Mycena floridula]
MFPFSTLFSCLLPQKARLMLEDCVFCHVSTDNGFNIVFQDESFFAFLDKKPASQHHIQIIPKAHIDSAKALAKTDAVLVRSMEKIGHRILDDLDVPHSMRKMGFHIPPFNSVQHLHLHVQGLPYNHGYKRTKYIIRNGHGSNSKGFSWFVEVQQAIRILENGKRITVLPG